MFSCLPTGWQRLAEQLAAASFIQTEGKILNDLKLLAEHYDEKQDFNNRQVTCINAMRLLCLILPVQFPCSEQLFMEVIVIVKTKKISAISFLLQCWEP